ncbi:MAG: threonine aldolase family protein [Alkalispirochaeta sp.]
MNTQRFLSDNASPAHPEIIAALSGASEGHLVSYGDDPITRRAQEMIAELLGGECDVHFVYNGTGANVSALRSVIAPWEAVICNEMAHINEDEGGAPEAIGGFKLIGIHRDDGKIAPAEIEPFLARRGFEHTNQPRAISITQVTEVGTLYTPEELRELASWAHDQDLLVHVDGARIANAAATWYRRERDRGNPITPTEALRAVSSDAGIDILSFGATKNGLLFGEAVVFFRRDIASPYRFARKQTTQLHSKMRYISAQFIRYLQDDLWLQNALAANAGARGLAGGLATVPGVAVALPVEGNGVFAEVPAEHIPVLQEEFGFYTWNAARNLVRLMVSWDTSAATIDRFLERCRELCR